MKTVFDYFEEIMSIPRESGKEEKITEYLVNYAKEHNLEYNVGKYNTVFLKKNNRSKKTIILQAHSDMMCVSNEPFDFDNNGIPYYIDGDYYKAKGTSLGADDGIGLAIILAILQEDKDMPNIEVMITTQEETTMLGASNFDYSKITGNTLISLDGVKEADIESSSAGMCSLTLSRKITYKKDNSNSYKLVIRGLAGGHSGDDISKSRLNAVKLAFQLLNQLSYKNIIDINIGIRDNVIPSEGYIVFSASNSLEELRRIIGNLKLSLGIDDNNLSLDIYSDEASNSIVESSVIYNFIREIPDGLLDTYKEDKFPLLSANVGKVSIEDEQLIIKYSIRGSDLVKEKELLNKLEELADTYHFNFKVDFKKPFFPFKEKSKIRLLLADSYKKLYGKDTSIKKVHACMEGGILANNIPSLDICAIAPNIDNCHSVNEQLSISSTQRVYDWLKDTLMEFNK